MFNIFKNRKEEPEETERELASIKFHIEDQSSNIKMSINIDDYSEECIEALARIIIALPQDQTSTEVLSIVQSFLMKAERSDMIHLLVAHLTEKLTMSGVAVSSKKEQAPCIKPSELMT